MSTTALYKALVYAKVPEELAEKAVEDLPHAESLTQAEFHNEIKELRIALEQYATKEQQDELRADLANFKTDIQVRIIKWIVGMTLASMFGMIYAMIALFALFVK